MILEPPVLTSWQKAVMAGLRRYSERHTTRLIARQAAVKEELAQIVRDTGAAGATPGQTLSRVLQELRRLGLIRHVQRGVDLLLDAPLQVDEEDLPAAAIDVALDRDLLRIGTVPTRDAAILARRRIGQEKVRARTLANYDSQCALCDVRMRQLLVASHIVRWSDDPAAQGRLANVICLCRMHDALFESGYIAFTDKYALVRRAAGRSAVIDYLQHTTPALRVPMAYPPLAEYLAAHRRRTARVLRLSK